MRVVIDTNRLESEELRVFLAGDRENRAVLPEHTLAEIFKQERIDSIFASFTVLRDFPGQTLVLVGNRTATRVDLRAPGIGNRLIDKASTRALPEFFAALDLARRGHPGYLKQLERRQRWARESAQTVELAMGDQSESLAEIRAQFSRDDLRRLGAGEPLSARSRGLILWAARRVSEQLVAGIGGRPLPDGPRLYRHFTWRYALCHLILMVRMLGKGTVSRKPEKARNDHFDNVFATFATYFNGVMTNDKETMVTQSICRLIIGSLGGRVSPDYLESGYILSLLDD